MPARVLRLDGTLPAPKSPGTAYVLMHHLMGELRGAGGWGLCAGVWAGITAADSRAVELALACKS